MGVGNVRGGIMALIGIVPLGIGYLMQAPIWIMMLAMGICFMIVDLSYRFKNRHMPFWIVSIEAGGFLGFPLWVVGVLFIVIYGAVGLGLLAPIE